MSAQHRPELRLGVDHPRIDREAGPLGREPPLGGREAGAVPREVHQVGRILAVVDGEVRDRARPRRRSRAAAGRRPRGRFRPRSGPGRAPPPSAPSPPPRSARRAGSSRRRRGARRSSAGSAADRRRPSTSCASRCTSVLVLPVPAPAITSSGPRAVQHRRPLLGVEAGERVGGAGDRRDEGHAPHQAKFSLCSQAARSRRERFSAPARGGVTRPCGAAVTRPGGRRSTPPGGRPRTGTRSAARPRRSSSRAGWRWPHRCARRRRPCADRIAATSCGVILAQLGQHVLRRHIGRVVVGDPLQPGDVPDRAQRAAADLARPLGQRLGHVEDLRRLLVEQQVIVAEVRAGHVPVEVLGLEIKREDVGQQPGQRAPRYPFARRCRGRSGS